MKLCCYFGRYFCSTISEMSTRISAPGCVVPLSPLNALSLIASRTKASSWRIVRRWAGEDARRCPISREKMYLVPKHDPAAAPPLPPPHPPLRRLSFRPRVLPSRLTALAMVQVAQAATAALARGRKHQRTRPSRIGRRFRGGTTFWWWGIF